MRMGGMNKRVCVLLAVLGAMLVVLATTSIALAEGGSASVTVTVPALNLRSGPGTSYTVVGLLRMGDVATVTGRNPAGDWYQVRLSDGRAGWVSSLKEYVALSGDASTLPVVAAPAPPAGRAAGGTLVFETSIGGAIYAVRPDGSSLRYLATGIDPAISPDGQWVAYTRWDGDANGSFGSLWVINVDGTREHRIVTGVRQPKSATWSPDALRIIFQMQNGGSLDGSQRCFTDPMGGGTRCFTMAADPHWALRIVSVVDGSTLLDFQQDSHSTSPTWDLANAWHVVYRGNNGLVSLDVNRLATWPLTSDLAQHVPVLSPDGKKIAFSYPQVDHWEVHVMNADGTGEVRLTETPLQVRMDALLKGQQAPAWNNVAPAWSPDGSQIAFLTDREGAWAIWVMNADGSNPHAILPAAVAKGLNLQYFGMEEHSISWR
jgi:uncharacterized protein YgiM (DUF1202 family)